jgi:hypothetical protein
VLSYQQLMDIKGHVRMNRTQITEVLNKITDEIEAIADDKIKSIQKTLLNLIEILLAENEELRAENQRLRDENNRLKGEQGKPNIRKQTQGNQNFSSEKERKQKNKKKNKKSKKKNKIKISRIEFCKINKDTLPKDVVFKGHQSVVVQDILITPNNVEFKKEIYYSPSFKKTYTASLPSGYVGEFSPNIKAEIISLYFKSKMTESAIVEYLSDHGIFIGAATVSRFLTGKHEGFHQEKKDIVKAGLLSTQYQQMDDTGARVNGKNYYAHVLCNEFYTSYSTRPNKDRMTIIEILTQGDMQFKFNGIAFSRMQAMALPEKYLKQLQENLNKTNMNRQEIDKLLNTLFPNPKKQQTNRQTILEPAAIAAYQELPHTVKLLLTDDAPQYNQITPYHPLCWVHDGRHYKKLNPIIIMHRKILNDFLEKYWDYYHKLLIYKSAPTAEVADVLSKEFDTLFSTETDYEKLNERIKKTKAKKDQLLLVLQYPEIPLHNNGSELGARDQGRRRDISFHTMNEKGTESKDTFMTIAQTARKLTVNFFHYIRDRLEKKFAMPSLASMILEQSNYAGLKIP